MEVVLKGRSHEIAALVLELQGRQETDEDIRRKYILACINRDFAGDKLHELVLDLYAEPSEERVEPGVVKQELG